MRIRHALWWVEDRFQLPFYVPLTKLAAYVLVKFYICQPIQSKLLMLKGKFGTALNENAGAPALGARHVRFFNIYGRARATVRY